MDRERFPILIFLSKEKGPPKFVLNNLCTACTGQIVTAASELSSLYLSFRSPLSRAENIHCALASASPVQEPGSWTSAKYVDQICMESVRRWHGPISSHLTVNKVS